MRKDAGFSFYELMVVIGILGILSAIAIPGFISWLPKHRVGSAAREVKSALEFARMTAIRNNATVMVNLDWGNDSLTVVDNNAVTLRTRQLPGDVDLQPNGLASPVTFNGQGFTNAGGGIVVVNTQNGAYVRNINLTVGGNARIH
jgi:prepilin-type N-terminal cleavage/methylation domain-containing protein